MESFFASLPEAIKNPFFWISLLSAIVALGLYLINRKTFGFIYAQSILEIIEISVAKVTPDGMGGFKERPFIKVKIINPSSFANYVAVVLKSSRFVKGTLCKARPLCNLFPHGADSYFEGTYQAIKPFEQVNFEFFLDDEFVETYLDKNLVLQIVDFRKKNIYKKFRFAPYPQNKLS